jgi:hypothetical protein
VAVVLPPARDAFGDDGGGEIGGEPAVCAATSSQLSPASGRSRLFPTARRTRANELAECLAPTSANVAVSIQAAADGETQRQIGRML